MARLLLDTGGKYREVFELGAGPNRFGRSEECDFHLDHSSVSGIHCELVLSAQGVLLRDCGSTNGTKVDGAAVTEAWLTSGQVIHIGALKLIVELSDAPVIIPHIEVEIPKPPVVLTDGGILCRRHPKVRATHRCTQCKELLCDACVHRLRRKGGKLHLFCALCSHACEPLGDGKPRKKSFLSMFKSTIRLPFSRKKEVA
jgi:pSer/pThr/pTyr-binding forkhead associated (FHA) protein